MAYHTYGSYSTEFLTEFVDDQAKGDEDNLPRLRIREQPFEIKLPVGLVNELIPMAERHPGLMPDYWLLERPGIRPCACPNPAEARGKEAFESLFYTSFCLTLSVGHLLVQKIHGNMNGRKRAIRIHNEDMLEEIEKMCSAQIQQEKMGLLGKVLKWAVVAVTASFCVATAGLDSGGDAFEDAMLLAIVLAAVIMQGRDDMDKIVKQAVDLLKKMGVDEKKANLVAGILVAVVMTVIITGVTTDNAGASALAASSMATGSMAWAAKHVAKEVEATNAAFAIGDGCNSVINGLLQKYEKVYKSNSYEKNKGTEPLEAQVNGIIDSIYNGIELTDGAKEELIQCIHDVMVMAAASVNEGKQMCK